MPELHHVTQLIAQYLMFFCVIRYAATSQFIQPLSDAYTGIGSTCNYFFSSFRKFPPVPIVQLKGESQVLSELMMTNGEKIIGSSCGIDGVHRWYNGKWTAFNHNATKDFQVLSNAAESVDGAIAPLKLHWSGGSHYHAYQGTVVRFLITCSGKNMSCLILKVEGVFKYIFDPDVTTVTPSTMTSTTKQSSTTVVIPDTTIPYTNSTISLTSVKQSTTVLPMTSLSVGATSEFPVTKSTAGFVVKTNGGNTSSEPKLWIIIVAVCCTIVLIVLVAVFVCRRRNSRSKMAHSYITDMNADPSFYAQANISGSSNALCINDIDTHGNRIPYEDVKPAAYQPLKAFNPALYFPLQLKSRSKKSKVKAANYQNVQLPTTSKGYESWKTHKKLSLQGSDADNRMSNVYVDPKTGTASYSSEHVSSDYKVIDYGISSEMSSDDTKPAGVEYKVIDYGSGLHELPEISIDHVDAGTSPGQGGQVLQENDCMIQDQDMHPNNNTMLKEDNGVGPQQQRSSDIYANPLPIPNVVVSEDGLDESNEASLTNRLSKGPEYCVISEPSDVSGQTQELRISNIYADPTPVSIDSVSVEDVRKGSQSSSFGQDENPEYCRISAPSGSGNHTQQLRLSDIYADPYATPEGSTSQNQAASKSGQFAQAEHEQDPDYSCIVEPKSTGNLEVSRLSDVYADPYSVPEENVNIADQATTTSQNDTPEDKSLLEKSNDPSSVSNNSDLLCSPAANEIHNNSDQDEEFRPVPEIPVYATPEKPVIQDSNAVYAMVDKTKKRERDGTESMVDGTSTGALYSPSPNKSESMCNSDRDYSMGRHSDLGNDDDEDDSDDYTDVI